QGRIRIVGDELEQDDPRRGLVGQRSKVDRVGRHYRRVVGVVLRDPLVAQGLPGVGAVRQFAGYVSDEVVVGVVRIGRVHQERLDRVVDPIQGAVHDDELAPVVDPGHQLEHAGVSMNPQARSYWLYGGCDGSGTSSAVHAATQ